MAANTKSKSPLPGTRSATGARKATTKPMRRQRPQTAHHPQVAPAAGAPVVHRKKFRRMRDFLAGVAHACETGWEYTKRTYQEGKHIRAFWQGYRACRTRKPLGQTLKELYLVARKWKILPFNYFRNALYDRNTPYADAFLSFMPEPVLFTRYMPILSPLKHRVLIHNKYFFHQLLTSYGIDSPSIALWSFDGTIYCKDGVVLSESDLTRALDDHVGETRVLKPQHLSNGKSVEFVSVVHRGRNLCLEMGDGTARAYAELRAACDQLGDWQLEAAVIQHPAVAAVYPDSVNTARIVTLSYPDGRTEILAALMRMGRNGSKIDNASAGGLHAHIDVESGQFLGPGYSKTDNATYTHHPDTGHAFAGVALPYWDEVVAVALRGSGLFMQTHTIAWDIAIGETGPIVIEGNPTWNPGTMERGSYPKGDLIIAAADAWQSHRSASDRTKRQSG